MIDWNVFVNGCTNTVCAYHDAVVNGNSNSIEGAIFESYLVLQVL